MASKKKVKKVASRARKHMKDRDVYSRFLADILSGVVRAVRLYETRRGDQLELQYDEEVDA